MKRIAWRSLVLTILAIVSIIEPAFSGIPERKLYVGKDSTQATLSFQYQVQFESSQPPSMLLVREKIESQVLHLFGPMGESNIKAVPLGNHRITDIRVRKDPDHPENGYVATYSYEGTIVVQDGPRSSLEVFLPRNPDRVYRQSIVKDGKNPSYPCTDEHYNSKGDFWYFWNPLKDGCPLVEGEHFDRVTGKIRRIKNTTLTYPEYDRLADEQGVIRISILMGMDDPSKGKNPLVSADTNAENYRDIRQALLNRGFEEELRWKPEKIEDFIGRRVSVTPYVEELTKKTPRALLRVLMFFGPTGIDEDSEAFHYFFKDALENSSVMIYDGHSGLGGHLDLPSIEAMEKIRLRPDPNRYQIYFFNSCSSYTYYNTMFFGRKVTNRDPEGTKNLDILTNGLATYFSVMHDTNLALIKAIDLWAQGRGSVSFQKLADQIDSGNLFGVNGDEDNPRR